MDMRPSPQILGDFWQQALRRLPSNLFHRSHLPGVRTFANPTTRRPASAPMAITDTMVPAFFRRGVKLSSTAFAPLLSSTPVRPALILYSFVSALFTFPFQPSSYGNEKKSSFR